MEKILSKRRNFWYFLAALSLIRAVYVILIPITPQEAYYWNYAQHLALSYFDHPPLAAYSIWLGTQIFGDHSFGVKFIGLIWSALTNILLYFITYRALDHQNSSGSRLNPGEKNILSFMAVILYNMTIFAHLYAITLMPDTPLLFFWLLTIYFYQLQRFSQQDINWIYAGMALGFAMLSKYTAVAILPGILLYMLLDPSDRKELRRPYPYLAIPAALLIFMPVIFWNWHHEWASFVFQFADRAGDSKAISLRYVGQLLASQFFQLLPLVAMLIPMAVIRLFKSSLEDKKVVFFILTGVPIIVGFSLISLTSLVKMNWLLPGYLGLFVAIVLLYKKSLLIPARWMKVTAAFSAVLILIAHSVLIIPNIPLGEGNTWSGWSAAALRIHLLQDQMGGEKKNFIFSNSYKAASLLKFYLPDHQETYAQNIYNRPALQFDYWSDPDSLKGRDAIYVRTDRREYKDDLKHIVDYFTVVYPVDTVTINFNGDIPVRKIFIYHAEKYQPDGTE